MKILQKLILLPLLSCIISCNYNKKSEYNFCVVLDKSISKSELNTFFEKLSTRYKLIKKDDSHPIYTIYRDSELKSKLFVMTDFSDLGTIVSFFSNTQTNVALDIEKAIYKNFDQALGIVTCKEKEGLNRVEIWE